MFGCIFLFYVLFIVKNYSFNNRIGYINGKKDN